MPTIPFSLALALSIQMVTAQTNPAGAPPSAVMKTEFIYEKAPFPSCHASTIAETQLGLVAAWFGGTDEGKPDVRIWISRHDGQGWSPPQAVADGRQPDGKQPYPCWNPVLFQAANGPLLLFYKVGPSPSKWWGMLIRSGDGGQTWSEPQRLPEGILGPIKDKPVLLPDGSLLCPSSTEHAGWRIHLERTPDQGATWNKTGPLNDTASFSAIQPSILFYPSGRTQMLCRSRQGRITESWMGATWEEWGAMQATSLPNPNSGIDAVMLKDGRALLVYNHTARGRSPLNVAVSKDGVVWQAALVLETDPGEYSYPAVIQAKDESVHLTYTWKRQRIKHVVVAPAKLVLRDLDSFGPRSQPVEKRAR